jgi:hypothetical protein
MMRRESTCRCLICGLERSLTVQLAERDRQERYRQFADSRSLLSAFPAPSDLIAYLHSCRNASNGTHPADRILGELLQTTASDGDASSRRDLLLLAFIPALHSTSRQVSGRYPSLPPDDVAQNAVASLLQILESPEFYRRSSHVAFSISRILKRHAFEWAERQCRCPVYANLPDLSSDTPPDHVTAESVERSALLRHFLHRCHRRGLLTADDLELLVQFKLDAARDATDGGPAAVYSNASRQRMKRLLQKLRHVARKPRNGAPSVDQLRLF